MTFRVSVTALMALVLSGCGGSLYGYSRSYQNWDRESEFRAREENPTYEEVRRARPETYDGHVIGWFGVVTSVVWTTSDSATVTLQFRPHEERHLCRGEDDDTCRVTVGARDLGEFVVTIPSVRLVDRQGQGSPIFEGSLLKVYASYRGEMSETLSPILHAEWYRHWPAHTYVDTRANAYMRR